MSKSIVILDFNDTMFFSRREDGYIFDVADAIPADGLQWCLSSLNEEFSQIVVATNQKTKKGTEAASVIVTDLAFSSGIPIDVYLANGTDIKTKPDPDMLNRALKYNGITDPELSWMIGDKWSDVVAANIAGMKSCAVGTFGIEQKGETPVPEGDVAGLMTPSLYAPTLLQAVQFIIGWRRTFGVGE